MTVELPPETARILKHLSADTARTPEELVREAVSGYNEFQRGILAAVEEGRAAAERGDMIDHEEVMSMMDEIILRG